MFSFFESRIHPTRAPGTTPPAGLFAFYWHFIRQTKGLYAAMFVTGLAVAMIDTLIPVFIGKLVTLMQASDRAVAFANATPTLLTMAALLLIGRPLTLLADSLVRNNAVVPGVTSLIRWQSHWHVVRQGWPFFQNDFAGRIANRVVQTAASLRECVVASIRAIWYIVIYGLSALVLMALADWRLAIPTVLWFGGYVFFLRYFVPRMRDLAKLSSELRSLVMGRVVDSYTNILTVKLFARARDEDAYVRDAIDDHTGSLKAHMRLITRFMVTLSVMNATLLVSTAAIGITLWGHGQISAGIVVVAAAGNYAAVLQTYREQIMAAATLANQDYVDSVRERLLPVIGDPDPGALPSRLRNTLWWLDSPGVAPRPQIELFAASDGGVPARREALFELEQGSTPHFPLRRL